MEVSSARIAEEVQKRLSRGNAGLKGVCFDYFDTIVHRVISPEYTKVLAAKRLKEIFQVDISHKALYELRSALEKKLCEENARSGHDQEFNLEQLGVKLFTFLELLTNSSSFSVSQDTFVQIFSEIEIAVETSVQVVNSDVLKLLQWLYDKNIPIYLVSDFYIPGHLYQKMLQTHKIDHLFEAVFISADHLETKSSGKLYGRVLDSLPCEPGEMLMVGDNRHSDYLVPDDLGIDAFLLESEGIKKYYRTWEAENGVKERIAQNHIATLEKILAEKGENYFPEMAATLWLFIAKLFTTLRDKDVKNVLFCSKEGEFLKKLFDTYQHTLYGHKIIRSHYLLVSRKATFIASLRSLDKEDFGRLFAQYRDISIEEFLLSLNFSEKQVGDICDEVAVNWKDRKSDLQNDSEFKELLLNTFFRSEYEIHRKKQSRGFLRYLGSFGIDLESEGLHLVDVGWNGSIQNNIFHSLQEKIEVNGYYIGLLSPNGVCDRNRKKGLIFSDYEGHTPFIHVYNNNRSLFEMMLGASHGSADGYFFADEEDHIEKERKSMVGFVVEGNPKTTVTTLDLPEERTLFKEQIAPLQQQMQTIFQEFTKVMAQTEANPPDEKWFAKKHARMVFKPTREEVEFYASLYHLENFGIFEFTRFSAETRIGLLEKLKNLRSVAKAPEQYLETGVWPPIILRRLGLDFLQPVDGAKRMKRVFEEKK